MKEAMRLFPGGTPAYGGVVVGEAYRVCEDQVAEIAFAPRDERSWGKGGTAALLTFPRRSLTGSDAIRNALGHRYAFRKAGDP